jgi:hypothetical protein
MGWTCFCFNWTATTTGNTINFKFRNDPRDWFIDDVSVLDSSANQLITNGGFEGGTSGIANGHPMADSWFWSGSSCSCCIGVVTTTAESGTYSWDDGCSGATDNLSQPISTISGNTYYISWWLKNSGSSGPASFAAIIT